MSWGGRVPAGGAPPEVFSEPGYRHLRLKWRARKERYLLSVSRLVRFSFAGMDVNPWGWFGWSRKGGRTAGVPSSSFWQLLGFTGIYG